MIQPIRTSASQMPIERRVDPSDGSVAETVANIVRDIRERGDEALLSYTKTFDGVELEKANLQCSLAEQKKAAQNVDTQMKKVMEEAAANIRAYHERALPKNWFMTTDQGAVLGQKQTPIDSVGIYIPAGSAPLASSVLMTAIPAKVAGVQRIVVASPPDTEGQMNEGILAACAVAGVDEVYKMGGAQAIAAFAYGTESVPKVDKIVGPGNIYVATAKKQVYGDVDIDMFAGPSEIVIAADEQVVSPRVVAADLLSQAEHDPLASAILLTTSEPFATQVAEELESQVSRLPRESVARASLESYGGLYVLESLDEVVQAINKIAPEHLELMVKDPYACLDRIRHAGAIFIGPYSAESVGDYFAGPSHVLPTNGTARFSSPLSVEDFMKRTSIIHYSEEALQANASSIAEFARLEELEAHARAVEVRMEEKS
ncbi:histidinol dehydrogenase [Bacillaceae bacterium SIJ1]|uniref:histidinol dehydrogenase n=1 Tax=Litoribacterium kuwaitense TaxID=1398745 RepID=UPI0013EA4AC1|nr:histidinol dehydrogenase [Litoribacterium kuwaitense]NGP45335.1 histidinol dehydrogenase [Litoribacterium kuwaitense]